MGFAANGICYPDQLQAMHALCASYPITTVSGTDVITVSCQSFTSSVLTLRLAVNSTSQNSFTVAPRIPVCDPDMLHEPWKLTVSDAVDVSWLVVGAWAIAWAAKQMHKHFNQTVSDT